MNIINFIEEFTTNNLLKKTSLRRDVFNTIGNLGKKSALVAIPFGLGTTKSRAAIVQDQNAAIGAYAVGYISSDKNQLILDAKELPEPPEGMVYQVWSLQFDPLTPTSMGLLEDFAANAEKIFYLNADFESEGFGITLEPAGGSAVPNLDQLYVLGAIES